MSQSSQERWEAMPPVAKRVISHLSTRNWELKSEKEKRDCAERIALSMLSKCGGDIFGYAKEVRLWRVGYAMSIVRPYFSKKTGKVTSHAHYNRNGKYIKRCKEGDDPIPVPTGMVVTPEAFRWSEDKEDFVPIPYEELEWDADVVAANSALVDQGYIASTLPKSNPVKRLKASLKKP